MLIIALSPSVKLIEQDRGEASTQSIKCFHVNASDGESRDLFCSPNKAELARPPQVGLGKCLKKLEAENARLKRLVAELALDKQLLQEVAQKRVSAGQRRPGEHKDHVCAR
jgi:hypothetical protein